MKAKDLAKQLLELPEYEVSLLFYDKALEPIFLERKCPFPPYRTLIIIGIADVGVSDKEIILKGEMD